MHIRKLRLVAMACLVVSMTPACKKDAKKAAGDSGPKEGELIAGGLCERGKRHGWRRIKVEYTDGAAGRLGCGELHGEKEALSDKAVKPVAAVFVGKPGPHPDNPVKFYDERGRMLLHMTLCPLVTAYLRHNRFLVVVTTPPIFQKRCIIRDVRKKRTLDFVCVVRPVFRAQRAAWLEWDEGKTRPTCVHLQKRETKLHAALPELKDKPILRWSSDTAIEVTGVLADSGKPFRATYRCP